MMKSLARKRGILTCQRTLQFGLAFSIVLLSIVHETTADQCIKNATCDNSSTCEDLLTEAITNATKGKTCTNITFDSVSGNCTGGECCCGNVTNSRSDFCVNCTDASCNVPNNYQANSEKGDCDSLTVTGWACAYPSGESCINQSLNCSYFVMRPQGRSKEETATEAETQAIEQAVSSASVVGNASTIKIPDNRTENIVLVHPESNAIHVTIPPWSKAEKVVFVVATLFKKVQTEDDVLQVSTESKMSSDQLSFIGVNTSILIISLYDKNNEKIKEPVDFTIDISRDHTVRQMSPNYKIKEVTKSCMFYKTKTKAWTDSVCQTLKSDENSTSCYCNHNSAFAIVFSVRKITVPDAVSKLSTVLEIISIIFLLITTIVLVIYRTRMRNFDRVLVQINLCAALMFMHFFFVIGQAARNDKCGCTAMAALSHLFLISSAVLMVMEGTLLLIKVLAPHFLGQKEAKRRRIVAVLVAWMLPLLYAILCAAVAAISDSYLDRYRNNADIIESCGPQKDRIYENCWIGEKLNLYVALIPVSVALFINLCIATRLGMVVWKMSKSAEEFKPSHMRDENNVSHAGKAFRAVALLLPILGLPWILGFLVNISGAEVIMITIHSIVNGLQGLFIFVLYIVLSKEVRKAVKRSWETSLSASTFNASVQFVSTSSATQTLKHMESETDTR